MDRKTKSMLGLARRANAIRTGDFAVSQLVSEKKAKIVIVARDAGNNTKKKFSNSCHFYNTTLLPFSTKEEISACIGKENVAVLAIEDENFAKKITELVLSDEEDKKIIDNFDYRFSEDEDTNK